MAERWATMEEIRTATEGRMTLEKWETSTDKGEEL